MDYLVLTPYCHIVGAGHARELCNRRPNIAGAARSYSMAAAQHVGTKN